MSHSDTIIYRDGVELFGNATGRFNFARDKLTQIFQVHVTWHELGERVNYGNNGLFKVAVFHAGRTPQCSGACHIAALGGGTRSILRHGVLLYFANRGFTNTFELR